MSKFYKLILPRLLVCLTFISLTLSPCNCFAEEKSPEKNSSKAHACCDEAKSDKTNNQTDGCDNCTGCEISSSCSSDSVFTKTSTNSLESNNKIVIKVLAYDWLPIIEAELSNINHTTGPPGPIALSSSTRSSLLQRWLI